MAAARTGSVDVLRLLLAHGADVGAREDWRGQTAATRRSTAPRCGALSTGRGYGSQPGSGAIIASELRLIRSPSGFRMRKPLASILWPACADGSG